MASPLEDLARARYRGVTYMPPANMQAAPARTPSLSTPMPGLSLAASIAGSPGLMAKAGAAQAKSSGGGGLGGLGWVVGHGAKLGLGALTALDYPRAAVVSTLGEAFDVGLPLLNRPLGMLPGVQAQPYDQEAIDSSFDFGDLWKNTKRHAGAKELIVEPIMGEKGTDRPGWMKNLAGFGLDIAADPLTYIAGGTGAVAGKTARAEYVTSLILAQKDAAETVARTIAEREVAQGAARVAADEAVKVAEERAAKLGGEEAAAKIMKRGVNTANREQLEAMDPTLRHGFRLGHKGPMIPGTEPLSAGVSKALGPIKGAIGAGPLGRVARAAFTPTGAVGQTLKPQFERLLTGRGSMPIEHALAALEGNQIAREARGTFASLGARNVDNLAKELRHVPLEERQAMQRQAEELAHALISAPADQREAMLAAHVAEHGENPLFKMPERMRAAAQVAGDVDIPELEGYVAPHVMSRDAFRWMNKLKKGENPLVETFRKVVGIENRDLLEEGGFLMRRSLKPGRNPDGTIKPLVLKFGKDGKDVVEIRTGSLAELEEKLGGYLRSQGFTGSLYEQDPVAAWRRYVESTKYDVAKRSMTIKGYERGLPGFEKPGALTKERYQPFIPQDLPPDADGTVRQTLVPNPEPPPADNEFIKYVDDERKTIGRNKKLRTRKGNPLRDILAETRDAAQGRRREIGDRLERLGGEVWEPTTKEKQLMEHRMGAERVRGLAAQHGIIDTDIERKAIEKEISGIDAELRRIVRKAKALQRLAPAKLGEQQAAVLRQYEEAYGAAAARRVELEQQLEAAITGAGGVRSKDMIERAKSLMPRRQRARVEALERVRDDAAREYRRHLDMARANFKLTNPDRYIEPSEYNRAKAAFEARLKAGELDEFVEAFNKPGEIEKQRAQLLKDAQELKARNDDMLTSAETATERRHRELMQRIAANEDAIRDKTREANHLNGQRIAAEKYVDERHPLRKLQRKMADYEKQEREILSWNGRDLKQRRSPSESGFVATPKEEPGSALTVDKEGGFHSTRTRSEKMQSDPAWIDVATARKGFTDSENELEAFLKASDEETLRATRPPPEPGQLTVKEQARLDAANKTLDNQSIATRTYLKLRDRLHTLANPTIAAPRAEETLRRIESELAGTAGAAGTAASGEIPWVRTAEGVYEYEGWTIRKVEAVKRGRTQWEIIPPGETAAAATPAPEAVVPEAATAPVAESVTPEVVTPETPPPTTEGRPPFKGEYIGDEAPADLSPRWWEYSRTTMWDKLHQVVDDSSLDQLDAIPSMSDADTERFVGEMWDIMPPDAKYDLESLGWKDGRAPGTTAEALPPAAPEQAALPETTTPPAAAATGGANEWVNNGPGDYAYGDITVRKDGGTYNVNWPDGKSQSFDTFPQAKTAVEGVTAPVAKPTAALPTQEEVNTLTTDNLKTLRTMGEKLASDKPQHTIRSKAVTGHLANMGLIEKYGTTANQHILTAKGEALVARIRETEAGGLWVDMKGAATPTPEAVAPAGSSLTDDLAALQATSEPVVAEAAKPEPLFTRVQDRGIVRDEKRDMWYDPGDPTGRFYPLESPELANLYMLGKKSEIALSPSETSTRRLERLRLIKRTRKAGNRQLFTLTERGARFVERVEPIGGTPARNAERITNYRILPEGAAPTVAPGPKSLEIPAAAAEGRTVLSATAKVPDASLDSDLAALTEGLPAAEPPAPTVPRTAGSLTEAKEKIKDLVPPPPAAAVPTPTAAPVAAPVSQADFAARHAAWQKDWALGRRGPEPVQGAEQVAGDTASVIEERNKAQAWIAKHPEVASKVEDALATKREMEALIASRTKQPFDPERHPFFPEVEQQQARMMSQAEQLKEQENVLGADIIPQIEQAKTAEDYTFGKLGEAGTTTGRMADETAQKLAAIKAPAAGAEKGLIADRSELDAIKTSLDQQSGEHLATYEDSQKNIAKSRARHDEISAKAAGLNRPRHVDKIIEDSARKGVPTGADLKRVMKGEMPSHVAQPLNAVIKDIDKVIAANPTGNVLEMNRIEAVLRSEEEALAKLTTEFDVPAHQLDRILKEAANGDLAPILKAMLKSDWKYVWEGGDYVIAKDLQHLYFNVAEQLDNKLFGRMLTSYTNFFKTYATMSPGFHVRNALSAFFMNSSEGVTLQEQMWAMRLWRKYTEAEDPVAFLARQSPQVQDAFKATFASGASQFTETGVSRAAGQARRSEVLFNNRFTRLSQRVGQDWVEGPQRLALGLNTTRYGGSLADATNRITRIHFDYSQVSKFDEQMKRIIPFWTFMSRNIPLQFTQMWMKPKSYLHFQSFARNFSAQPDEFFPEYIQKAGGFDTGYKTPGWLPGAAKGMPIAVTADLPHMRLQDDLNRFASALSGGNKAQILSDFNPAFTAPAEFLTNQDFFTGRRYDDTDISKANAAMTIPAALLSLVGGGGRTPNGGFYTNDSAINALRSLNPLLDRQMRLFPSLSGSGADPDRLLESWLRFGLGVPGRTISQDQMQGEAARRYFDAQRQAKALQIQEQLAG